MTTNSEIDVLKIIDGALNSIDSEAQVRVLNWLNSKYLGLSNTTPKLGNILQHKAEHQSNAPVKNKATKTKSTKKSKIMFKQDKELNLNPSGKKSAQDFVKEKQPTNVKQKCVVALYYLLKILEREKAGIDHIYTFFKGVGWPIPSNFLNTLHQAGTEGWLDTKDSTDYKITSSGENVVEYNLPKKNKN